MKKTVITTAVLAALVSGSALAASVYKADGTELDIGGRIEVRGEFEGTSTGTEIKGTMADASRARIDFEGRTELSADVEAFAKTEYQIEDGENQLNNREMYVGFKFGDTAVSYGRQDTANVQISDLTDIASAHSGQQQLIASASSQASNTFLVSSDINDITLQASYQVSGNEDQDAFGLSALWQSDFGLELGLSHTAADDQGSVGGDLADAEQTTFGLGYTIDDLYLAATYATGEITNNIDFDSFELAAQYKVSDAFRVIGIYGEAEVDSGSSSVDFIDFFAIEGQYRFNSSLRTYASYKANGIENAEDSLMVGLRYDF